MITSNDVAVLLSFLAAAIALAGFAGIVTSIDRRTVGASPEVISFRVRTLVIAAVSSVFIAMLPILVEALELAPKTLWQFSCIIGSSVSAAISLYAYAGRRGLAGADQGLSRTLFVSSMILGALIVAAGILGAGGVLPARGAYFLGQFFLLYQMFMLFYRMVRMADEAARVASQQRS